MASPNAMLEVSFHGNRLTGIRTLPYRSRRGDPSQHRRTLDSASHNAATATAPAPPAVVTTSQTGRSRVLRHHLAAHRNK
jgi:hypothetical protein